MDKELKERLKDKTIWMRGFYMLLFAAIYSITEIVIAVVAIFQFFFKLLTGAVNRQLLKFGQGLSTFIYQIMIFLTFNSEDKPYPFASWPQGLPETPKSASSGIKTSSVKKKTRSVKVSKSSDKEGEKPKDES